MFVTRFFDLVGDWLWRLASCHALSIEQHQVIEHAKQPVAGDFCLREWRRANSLLVGGSHPCVVDLSGYL